MSAPAQAQCERGTWEPALDLPIGAQYGATTCASYTPNQTLGHEAIHASLIPKGGKRGWIMLFGGHGSYVNNPPAQRGIFYALYDPTRAVTTDPTNPNPQNFCYTDTNWTGLGDMFCAGHAWTADGDLLLAGGTLCHKKASLATGQPCAGWGGSKLAYVWVPPASTLPSDGGTWLFVSNGNTPPGVQMLDEPRWYPSLVVLGPEPVTDEDRVAVFGGSDDPYGCRECSGSECTSPPCSTWVTSKNSYQVWRPAKGQFVYVGGRWQVGTGQGATPNTFAGPIGHGTGKGPLLDDYPRTHQMSAGDNPNELARVVLTGMFPIQDRVSHYAVPGVWHNPVSTSPPWGQQAWYRIYGDSVLAPILINTESWNGVIVLGGRTESFDTPPNSIRKEVDKANGNVDPLSWTATDPMNSERWLFTTAVLPDTRLFVVGGEKKSIRPGCSEIPALVPEIYDGSRPAGTRWTVAAPHTIIRDYHSTALTLPSGKVFVANGEYHRYLPEAPGNCAATATPVKVAHGQPAGVQIYQPDYIACGHARPIIPVPASGEYQFSYGSTYTITYSGLPDGVAIQRVVLIRAGSVTHHHDPNRRLVELNFGGSDTQARTLQITVPAKNKGTLPRGYYMMFFVSNQNVVTQGVPSQAVWVKVS